MFEYTQHVGEGHRKFFGQFFTHPDVAKFMTRWTLASGKRSLFDPAFGLGAFYEATPEGLSITFSACELDTKIVDFWQQKTGLDSSFIATQDYLRFWGKKHANIVCNPPYKRFQKFLNRNGVFQEFQQRLGIKLSGYTNTASAFLLKSLSELGPAGRMAYLMPLEFLNTGYGHLVKEKLIESRHLFAILSLTCEKDIFPDAVTSVGIILYDKAVRHASVKFYSVKSTAELETFDKIDPVSDLPYKELNPNSKWLPLFQRQEFEVDQAKTVSLDFFGRFSRGIATGANDFFVLRPSTAKEKGIEKSECVPCITKSSQICKPVFNDADYEALSASDKPVLLFSADSAHSEEAEKYIQFGENTGFNQRFITKNRKPWYKIEKRRPAPLLLGVFFRGGYKIILNNSNVLNLTCFHGFQPNLFGSQYLEHLFLYLSSATGRKIISLSMRKYGDSLDKFEPNDLNKALAPSPEFFALIAKSKVAGAVEEIKDTGLAPQWADDLFLPLKQFAFIPQAQSDA